MRLCLFGLFLSTKIEMIDLPCLPDHIITPDPVHNYSSYKNSGIPIVIDNGAYHLRAGFASDSQPKLIFRNLIAKLRGKKEPEIIIGNDITNLEAVKWLLRSPFDNNVVTQFDVQETIFDHLFMHLGIDTESVEHPIALNEAVCVPIWSRSYIEELLFECYQVPSVLFGVDALFSFFYNKPELDNCLVISVGHHTSHILPIVNGRFDPTFASRVNLGGFNLTCYLQRLLQLKYPKLVQEFTFTKCETLVQKYFKVANDYQTDSMLWENDEYYTDNAKQFRTEKDFDKSILDIKDQNSFANTCLLLLEKVSSNLTKKREKQLIENEENRKKLKTLHDLVEDDELADPALIAKAYQHAGVKNFSELKIKLNELNQEVKRYKILLDPKQEQEPTVIDELKELQKSTGCDEMAWINYIKDIRCSRVGENAWILNEILREYEFQTRRSKRHVVPENVIELGPELIRIPEMLFSPNALINFQQCGISEAIENVIRNLGDPKLSENIFITGGCSLINDLSSRIYSDVTSMRPFQSTLNIFLPENSLLDAWNGGKKCCQEFIDKFVTRNEYMEFGPTFIKEFKCSNLKT